MQRLRDLRPPNAADEATTIEVVEEGKLRLLAKLDEILDKTPSKAVTPASRVDPPKDQ